MNTDSVTLFLAIWGAVLGTIGAVVSIILAVREFSKDRYKIKIQAEYSTEDPFWLVADAEPAAYVVLNVLNIGFRPIQIKSTYLSFDNGEKMEKTNLKDVKFPVKLEESESLDAYYEVYYIREVTNLKKTKIKYAVVIDGKGIEYKYHIPKSLIKSIQSHAH